VARAVREALPVVRELRGPTPLEVVRPESGPGGEAAGDTVLLVKREDVPPIYAYKWRGAAVRLARLSGSDRRRGVVAASAGNHAQGVALAAARLGVSAKVFMPTTTPVMKQSAVRRLGGELVETVITGDNFDAAAEAAAACAAAEGRVTVHAYDDPHVIAGQGTLAAELVDQLAALGQEGPDAAYLQIGGGGMAAGAGSYLRQAYPGIRLIGVEGDDQASMQLAVRTGAPRALEYVDVFCDGTAVRRAGDLTFPLCRDLLDTLVTVSNAEVCAAMRFLWGALRVVPEPAGAMGLAAWLAGRGGALPRRPLFVLCGANMDFAQFATVARHAERAGRERRHYRFVITEENGALLKLLEPVRTRADIIEFQYGKTSTHVAYPVIGMEATRATFSALEAEWRAQGVPFSDVSDAEDVEFGIVQYRSELFRHPYFLRVEFPERAGALSDFMASAGPDTGICYFRYSYSGERVGRALLGFEFSDPGARTRFIGTLRSSTHPHGLRSAQEVPAQVLERVL
jgi:threonine dehydratase